MKTNISIDLNDDERDVGNFKQVTGNIAEEGMKYYFNDVRVTPEEYEMGIHAWLEKRK